ncbi:MAG: hypothetical protein J5627_02815 [Bacilli bacterium]|nr:hypothetical protein [Bacilli bacterium]
MKKNNVLIILASVGGLMLSSCLCGWEGPLPNGKGDDISIAASSSVPLSSEEQSGPKDELIGQGADLEQDAEGNRVFRIEEFTEPFKLCKTTTSTLDTLKYGDVIISSNLYVGPQFVASDINGDGYRELVFLEKTEDRNRSFVVYDVKNSNILFKQADMTVEKHSHYASYRYSYDMRNGRLTFLPYIGNFSENSIVDYGHLKWSEQKGCYFEWENIFSMKQIILEGVYEEDTNIKLLQDGYREEWWTIDAYSLEKGKNYLMKYKVLRDDYTRNFGNSFLELEWSNENPSYLETCYPVENSCHPETGDYVMKFSVRDAYFEGARTWKWYFGSWELEVNYHILLGEASAWNSYN